MMAMDMGERERRQVTILVRCNINKYNLLISESSCKEPIEMYRIVEFCAQQQRQVQRPPSQTRGAATVSLSTATGSHEV